MDEALVSNWKIFLKPGNGRRSSSESVAPGGGWFRFNWRRRRVPFCPKYERFKTNSWRIGNSSDVLHCWRYGFAKRREVEKMLGCTDRLLSWNALDRSNCGTTGPLFLTEKSTNGGFKPSKKRLSPAESVS